MSIHSNTPLRQIKRYGTKGDYALVYSTGDSYNESTMSVTQGAEVSTPLLAFAEDKKTSQSDTGANAGVYSLMIAVDSDFNGVIPDNSIIRNDSGDYNISNVQVHRVKNVITFIELTING